MSINQKVFELAEKLNITQKPNYMKKIFTLLSAALLCFGASAASATTVCQVKKAAPVKEARAMRAAKSKAMSAPMRSNDLGALELNFPPADAQEKQYSRNCEYFMLDYGGLFHSDDYGAVSKVAYDGTKVYIYSPFTGMPTDTYLVGELSGDKVTVTFPQKIDVYEYEDYDNDPTGELGLMITENYYAYEVIFSSDGETESLKASEDQTVTFTVTDNGLVQDGDTFIAMLLGEEVEDGNGNKGYQLSWTGYADAKVELTEVTAEPLTIPEGLALETWVMTAGEVSHLVKVAMSGVDVYVQGLFADMPEAVIKGSFDGANVTFATDQFLGVCGSVEHYAYFIPADYTYVPATSDDEEDTYDFVALASVSLALDAEAKTLSTPEGKVVTFSTIPGQRIYYIDAYLEPQFAWQDMSTPMTPADPEIVAFENLFDDYGFSMFDYILPTLSTDGRVLDKRNCFYNILIDGEPMVVYYEDLEDISLSTEYTDIPVDYEDFYNITNYYEYVEALIFMDGYDSIGIRMMYINEDGTVTYSNVVTYGLESVEDIEGSAEVVDVKYFDINGHAVSGDARGLVIGVYKMSDGKVKVAKLVK